MAYDNNQYSPQEFTTAAELTAHYSAILKRRNTQGPIQHERRWIKTRTIPVPPRPVKVVVTTLPIIRAKPVPLTEAEKRMKKQLVNLKRWPPIADETLQEILEATCKACNIGIRDVASNSRIQRSTNIRHTFFYIAHFHYGIALARLGREIGRDHSTVHHAVHKVASRFDEFQDMIDATLCVLGQEASEDLSGRNSFSVAPRTEECGIIST